MPRGARSSQAKSPPPESSEVVNVALQAEGDGPICGEQCASSRSRGQSLVPSKIITQPTVTGVVAPSAALLSAPDGGAVSVIDEAGGVSHEVRVTASARGMSVIEGVDSGVGAGVKVRVPASAEAAR